MTDSTDIFGDTFTVWRLECWSSSNWTRSVLWVWWWFQKSITTVNINHNLDSKRFMRCKMFSRVNEISNEKCVKSLTKSPWYLLNMAPDWREVMECAVCMLIIALAFKSSGAKNCVENPLKIRNGDWLSPPAFLHNLNPAHTLNICSYPLFLFLLTCTSNLTIVCTPVQSHKTVAALRLQKC